MLPFEHKCVKLIRYQVTPENGKEKNMKKYRLWLGLLLLAALVLPVSAEESETPPETTACAHSYDAGTVTAAPTCGREGTKTFTCGACGATKTETIPATGSHSWDNGSVTLTATCQKEGIRTVTCTVCGSTEPRVIPADPAVHSFGAWNPQQEGTHTRTCACGASESGNHVFDVSATVPATCKEEGANAYGCSICGRIEYTIIPKLTTHTYDNVCDPDCNVCGLTRETAHSFSAAWSKNAKGHWHICTKCSGVDEVKNHYAGPAATEEKDQLCLTCGYLLTPKLGHVHKYASSFSSDESGHWYACAGCDDQKDFSQHTYDNACDTDCNICGFVTETAHTAEEAWNHDESGHWHLCAVCETIIHFAEHTPGSDGDRCAICGFTLPTEAHTHAGGETWQSDGDFHWKVCDCGEIQEKVEHIWKDNTCSVCGTEQAEEEASKSSGISTEILLLGLIGVILLGIVVCVILLLFPTKHRGKYGR